MTDHAQLIDDAQPVAEQLLIEQYLGERSRETYMVLGLDPECGAIVHEVGCRRGEVLLEMPDDTEVFAVYKMVDGQWHFDSGTPDIDHVALLAEFSAGADYARAYSQHPARRRSRYS